MFFLIEKQQKEPPQNPPKCVLNILGHMGGQLSLILSSSSLKCTDSYTSSIHLLVHSPGYTFLPSTWYVLGMTLGL